jgi:predicted MFS family arabinose efflux permease
MKLAPGSWMVFAMAAATGLAVANLYYAQPLLDTLARAFTVSAGTAGLIVTLTQLGYAVGLAFVVPLGDLLERRRLIIIVTLATAAALAMAAWAPTIGLFLAASLLVGVTAVVAQVLVPFAAHLAADHERGRVVGQIMTGLLLGILLARTVSGAIADLMGWRAVFWLAAVIMLLQALMLVRILPPGRGDIRLSYPALLVSVLHLLRDEPVLRRRTAYGMMSMASFSVLWTALPFLLANAPYGYSDTVIGLFGLVGAAGAACATFAGHLHDRGGARTGTGCFLALIVAAFALMGLLGSHLVAIIAGVLLLDIGAQGTQVLNQSAIYQLRPDARSRITTAYMTCFFFGGVLGSAGAAYMYGFAGWPGVAWLGGAFGTAGLLMWMTEAGPPARGRRKDA